MPFGIGPLEIVVVLIIALVVFGPKRLPELGKSLGEGIREFRGTMGGEGKDDDDDDDRVRALERSQAQARAESVESVEGEVVTDKRS